MMLMFIGRVRVRHIMLVVGTALIPVMLLILVATHYYNKEDHTSKDLPCGINFWKNVNLDKAGAGFYVQR